MKALENHLEVFQASAGSGKTFTLVKQYLCIAFQQPTYKFKQILALTFTNAAAFEMKERIMHALKDLITNADPGLMAVYVEETGLTETELQQRAKTCYEAILANYDGLSIMTIDAFQQRVVKGFTTELGLPNDFNTLIEDITFKTEMLQSLVEEIGRHPFFTKASNLHQKELLKDAKNWDLTPLVEVTLQNVWYFKGKKENLNPELIVVKYQELKAKVEAFIKECTAIKKEVTAVMTRGGFKYADFKRNPMTSFLDKIVINDLSKALSNENSISEKLKEGIANWRAMEKDLCAGKFKGDKNAFNQLVYDEVIPLFEKMLALYEGLHPQDLVLFFSLSQFIALAFTDFVQETFFVAKEKRSLVSIGDSEYIIGKIIASDELPFIYEKLGLRYKYILIDEFQDTSLDQWKNLKPLVEESLANGDYSMIVGDSKQSIYAWRGGEAQQFIDLYQKKVPLNIKASTLGTNYRSYPGIINFNNEFFTKLYQYKDLGAFQIFENGAQLFNPKYAGKEDLGYVHAKIFDDGSIKEQLDEQYFNHILERVEFYKSQGYDYGEMCFIDRTNTNLSELALLLESNNIPNVIDGKLLLVKDGVIRLVESLIQIFLNVNVKINQRIVFEVLGHLTNANISEFELTFYNGGEMNWEAFRKAFNIEVFEENNLILNFWQSLKCNQNIKLPNTQYVRVFEELLYDLEKKKSAFTLAEFWQFWELERSEVALPDVSDFNGVNLMTIHKSKGLEFPVVFYLGKKKKNKTASIMYPLADYGIDGEVSVSIGKAQKSLLNELQYDYQSELNKGLIEEANLVYVGFTRAKAALDIILLDTTPNGFGREYLIDIIQEYCALDGSTGENEFERGVLPLGGGSEDDSTANQEFIVPGKHYYKRLHSLIAKEEEASDQQEFGIAFHEAIAKFKTPQEFQKKGERLAELHPEIFALCQAFFNNKEVLSCFEDVLETMEEEAFYDGVEHIRQPDKVILTSTGVKIIDFKTGVENEEVEEQLGIYENIFKQLGHQHIEKYVYYTQSDELLLIKNQ